MSKTKFKVNDNVMTPFGGGKIKEIKLYNKKVYYVVTTEKLNIVLKENKIAIQ